ncbi:MAG: helix-turn-helix domain-containing protein, partial [bacterium]
DYLTKPFNTKELHVRVHNLIEQRRKLRELFVREGMLQPRKVAVTSVDDRFLQKLMTTIEAHISDEDFSVENLSEQMIMGRRQLHRKIKALTDQAPTDFIRSVRLQRAKQMLEQNAGSISEIAYAVGFNNLSYFSKSFREQFGKLPSEIAR